MFDPSQEELLALLGLRLSGFASAETVAELVRLDVSQVHRVLHAGREQGLVQYREGRMTGWSLTPDGRSRGEQHLAGELDARACRGVVEACYLRFLSLNGDMLAICTDWQMRNPETLNDHADPAYDAKVIDRLSALHEDAQPICTELGQTLERFLLYVERLSGALERVRAGEHDWFTGVRIPSYHSVWFELHENLLATLGIDRSREPT
jgi:hypothetical protein